MRFSFLPILAHKAAEITRLRSNAIDPPMPEPDTLALLAIGAVERYRGDSQTTRSLSCVTD